MCILLCKMLHTTQHGPVLIIIPLNLQSNIIAHVLSTGGEGSVYCTSDMSLTRVNLEHISSASAILPDRSIYFAHLELMYRSAMSRDCASSSQYTAVLISPACCRHAHNYMHNVYDSTTVTILYIPITATIQQCQDTLKWADSLCSQNDGALSS